MEDGTDAASYFLRCDNSIREAVIVDSSLALFFASMVSAQPPVDAISLYNEATIDAWGYDNTDNAVKVWIFMINPIAVVVIIMSTFLLAATTPTESPQKWCTWGIEQLSEWHPISRIIGSIVLIALISTGAFFLSDEVAPEGIGPAVFTALTVFVTGIALSSYKCVKSKLYNVRKHMHKEDIFGLLVILRVILEVLILTTIFITLPVVLGGKEARVFRSGIGFAIGTCIAIITGRDAMLVSALLWSKDRRSIWHLGTIIILWAYATAALFFSTFFMVTPAFTDTAPFITNSRPGILLATAFSTQLFALGSAYSRTSKTPQTPES